MNKIISYCICGIILFISIITSIKRSINERSIKFILERTFYYFSIFITFLIIYFKIDIILNTFTIIISDSINVGILASDVLKIVILMCLFFIMQISIYFILKKVSISIFKYKEKVLNLKFIFLSSFIGFSKGIIITLIIFLSIITYNTTLGYYNKLSIFENTVIYNKLYNMVLDKKVSFNEEYMESVLQTSNFVIFYNGVTIDEGVKSTETIDIMALELTQNCKTEIEKARVLYSWIGNNIEYDYEKAELALNNEKLEGSGAITAWNNRSGICFDYSCLYVAMSKAAGLKVRLITGEAFDGNEYGPHAWNEVYIKELDKWIPIDTTFYLAGNYFNNYDFYDDHIKDNIAGEW